MQQKITFIHAADLHLDSPFQGLAKSPERVFNQAQESTFQALERLADVAIKKDVDFVLLVGDIFDENIQSLKASIKLRQAFEKLQQHNINVYMSYGNHDYINGHIHNVTYPTNVFVFPDEHVTAYHFPNDAEPCAVIYGFSYEQRNVISNKALEYEQIGKHIPFHIATLHGSLYGDSTHATYAPFALNDLMKHGFDYWALGHIHKRQVLHDSPPVVYPGNIQGRHHLENGPKGCYYVELSETTYDLTFIPLHEIEFSSIRVDVTTCEDVFALEQAIEQQLATLMPAEGPTLIKFHLIGDDQLYVWEHEQYIAEIIELLNERYVSSDQWLFIYDVTTEVPQTPDQQKNIQTNHFHEALNNEFPDKQITHLLKQLYEHPQARKFLQPLSKEDELMIKEKAKHLLMNDLFETKG